MDQQQQLLQQLLATPEGQAFSSIINVQDPQAQTYILSILTAVNGNMEDALVKLQLDTEVAQAMASRGMQPSVQQLAQIKTPYQQIVQMREMKSQIQSQPMQQPVHQQQPQMVMQQGQMPQQQQVQQSQPMQQGQVFQQPQQQTYQQPAQIQQRAPITTSNNSADVVSPFNRSNVPLTQSFNNFNPGMGYYNDTHKGEDYGTTMGEEGRFPIGGQVISSGYDPAYGNSVVVRGYNPREFNQLSQSDRGNFRGGNEDYVRLSHLQSLPNVKPGQYVATGSAGLKFGSTGNSTGPHLDIEAGRGDYNNYQNKQSFSQSYPQVKYLSQTTGKGGTGGGGGQYSTKPTYNASKISKSIAKFESSYKPMNSTQFVSNVKQTFNNIAKPVQQQVYKSVASYAPKVQKQVQQVQRQVQPTYNKVASSVDNFKNKVGNFFGGLFRR